MAGALSQHLSIWNEVGSSLAGLRARLDGVESRRCCSGMAFAVNPNFACNFSRIDGTQLVAGRCNALYAVAVRAEDPGH